jgi:hypothetical protein
VLPDITIIHLFYIAVNQEIRNPCYLVTSICTRCSVSRSAKHGIVCLDNIVRSTYVYSCRVSLSPERHPLVILNEYKDHNLGQERNDCLQYGERLALLEYLSSPTVLLSGFVLFNFNYSV